MVRFPAVRDRNVNTWAGIGVALGAIADAFARTFVNRKVVILCRPPAPTGISNQHREFALQSVP